jgi:hypothetical protein
LRNVRLHQYGGAWGAEVADEQKEEGGAGPLRLADDETLDWARSFWPEAPADAFQWDQGGRKVVEIATGETLKIRFGEPKGGELESDIACFVVRDGRIILLGKPGGERPRTTHLGFYYGKRVEYAGPPSEGAIW